jgi:hypothetical protein
VVSSYRETIPMASWVMWVLVALFLSCALAFLLLRDAVAADAPGVVWIWDLIWLSTLLCTLGVPVLFGRLVVLVEGGSLVVRFGFLGGIEKAIPLQQIERAEVVRYRPIRQFGGWGLRVGKFGGARTVVYSMRGSSAVLLTLAYPIHALFVRTDRILIGTETPHTLADALNG